MQSKGDGMACFRSLIVVLVGFLGAQMAGRVEAAPTNDDWANRTVIASLPFSTAESNMSQASVEATDPTPPCLPFSSGESQTLWYSYTTGASMEYLTLAVPGNTINAIVTVYSGSPGAFTLVSGACVSYSQYIDMTRIAGLRLAPDTTYSIKVGATFPVNANNTLNFSVVAATQYHVTTTADTNDGSCGIATCSLRDAISASNASAGAVLIPSGTYTLSIGGANEDANATGDLDAQVGMGIYGAGMAQTIIDAYHLDRVLHLDSHSAGSTSFSIGDFALRNGNAATSNGDLNDYNGGGMLLSSSYEPNYIGIERIAALSNSAHHSGGGLYIVAPGTIRDSVISDNVAQLYYGGGLGFQFDTGFHLDVSGSTFAGNSALTGQGMGGGIFAQGALFLSNSTVSGNYAGHQGGGILLEGSGALTMSSSTVVLNSAGDNPNLTQGGGGIYIDSRSSDPFNVISNSIVAYNTVINPTDQPDCAIGYQSPNFSSSYNLVFAPNNCDFTGTGDVVGVDPLLSTTLAYSGGPTPTHALLAGSPAIDSANPVGCADAIGNAQATDQRGAGFPRIVGALCDRGAVEKQVVAPPGVPVLDAASDSGSSNADDITNVAVPVFSGSCTDGDSMQLIASGQPAGAPFTCSGGSYSIGAALAEGYQSIAITATRASLTSGESSTLLVVIDRTAPEAPTITGPGGMVGATTPISGTATEASGLITVSEGATTVCTAPGPFVSGNWLCQPNFASGGTHVLTATQTDIAGNVSDPSPAFDDSIDLIFRDGFD